VGGEEKQIESGRRYPTATPHTYVISLLTDRHFKATRHHHRQQQLQQGQLEYTKDNRNPGLKDMSEGMIER